MTQHEWMRRRALDYQDWILNDNEAKRMERMKLFMRYESQHECAYDSGRSKRATKSPNPAWTSHAPPSQHSTSA